MAQGVTWWARHFGLKWSIVALDTAPESKISAIRLGYQILTMDQAQLYKFTHIIYTSIISRISNNSADNHTIYVIHLGVGGK